MIAASESRRRALTLIEALVVIAILVTLVALLFPAIQMVRAAADRMVCMNQMKQVCLATHQYSGDRGGRLPALDGGGNDDGNRALFFVLLPYIEHGNYYVKAKESGVYGGNYLMRQYICPSDPSIDWSHAQERTSYAANGQVFLDRSRPRMNSTFRDGTSRTIAYAEHYAMCPGHTFSWFLYESMALPPSPDLPKGLMYRRAGFADFIPGGKPYDSTLDDVHPITGGSPPSSQGSIRELSFQITPKVPEADGRVAQTGHPGGMVIGMGDASVQALGRGTSPEVYWALVTPAGGESASLD